mmetsp:Transcript_19014/g.48297  ORF Transcript_19014/g.48297 Transcript_19014/m.48297 type:complete len:290 (+) Transcript_19014:1348-2217(+)
MKVPKLWQKWHRMMAHTSFLDSSAFQGMSRGAGEGGAKWPPPPPSLMAPDLVPCAALLPCECAPMVFARMYARSSALMRAQVAGEEADSPCQAANHTSPIAPNTWNTDGQPAATIICGEADSPMMEPQNMPLYTSDSERDRSLAGTHLDSRLFMAGMATPSPIPMSARAAHSGTSPADAAAGVRAVAMDHHTTPAPSTSLPPNLSAHTPPATCVTRYPQKKEDCTRPTVALSHPYCAFMGRMATAMLTRSMLHSMKAKKHRATMLHLLLHPLNTPDRPPRGCCACCSPA